MGFKIIEVSDQVRKIYAYLDNIVFYTISDKKLKFSIADIDIMIVDNIKLLFTVHLMNMLTKNNVVVIFCDEKHLPFSQTFPLAGNYKSLKVVEKQINWTQKTKDKLWQEIIKLKILVQQQTLKHFKLPGNEQLSKLYENVKKYDATNREGHAAKIYFHNLFGINFSRDDEDNRINHLLNYGYAILLAMMARSIVKKGLDLRIAIFHKSFSNCYALACDLMEPFRPIVDSFVFLVKNATKHFSLNDFKVGIIKLFTKKMRINGLKKSINCVIDNFVDELINERIINVEIDYQELLVNND